MNATGITRKPGQPLPRPEAFLPLAAPWFGPEEKEEILRVLDSDWITTGPRTQQFEKEFAGYIGCKEAVAVNSCTGALHLGLLALGVGPDDAVITSPFTFCATANVVDHCGAQPIFVDIRPGSYNLDPACLERFVNTECQWDAAQRRLRTRGGKTVRALIAVHYGGQACDMDEIAAFAERYGLTVMEDAAHAIGARYKGRNVGLLGHMAAFSFYATKNVCTGEGGMFTTNDEAVAQRVRSLCLHGMSRDAWTRYGKTGSWRYDVTEAGFKYNLADLASALGIHQLRKVDAFNRRRAELAALYRELLQGLPLRLPTVLPQNQHAWHLYPVQVLSERVSRDEVFEKLRDRNIGSSVHFIPLHLMSFYQRKFGYKEGDFPVCESVFRRIISLPMFPRMSDGDVRRVAAALKEILDV